MRTRIGLLAAVALLPLLTGCGDDDVRLVPPSGPGQPVQVLAAGKSVVPLDPEVQYASPSGFEPSVTFSVRDARWISTHRGPDAFDLSRPRPNTDAALVVYAFVVPPEATARLAIRAIRRRAAAAGTTVTPAVKGTWKFTGGSGPLITSRDGGIALDAVPGGYAWITTAGPKPLLTLYWVPDARQADAAEELVGTLHFFCELDEC